jgi:hypothetical protein
MHYYGAATGWNTPAATNTSMDSRSGYDSDTPSAGGYQVALRAAQIANEVLRKELLAGVLAHVGSEAVVREHFTPRYLPWRQRIAFIPDGDFFAAIRSGRVAVVTDEIEGFVEDGVQVKSGATIGADIVIAATGLELQALGGIALEVDGVPVDPAQCLTWRGMMFTGLPNLMWVFGYFRASWTLRVDLLGDLAEVRHAARDRRDAHASTAHLDRLDVRDDRATGARGRCGHGRAGRGRRRDGGTGGGRGGRGARRRGVDALAVLGEHGDHVADLHLLALGADQARDGAVVEDGLLHRRLVGLDVGEHRSGAHSVALFDVPLDDGARFHRVRETRHGQFDRHRYLAVLSVGSGNTSHTAFTPRRLHVAALRLPLPHAR